MELTLDEALQKAIKAHKAGQVQEADRLYTAIIQAQPKHPDANHNRGVLAVGVGKVQEALPYFKTALEANSSIGQYWLSYIDALMKIGRLADAQTVFDQAKDKGAKGEAFDQLEQQLSEQGLWVNETNKQDPPSRLLQPIINLYTQGQMQQALSEASKMLEQFPNSVLLCNIAGSSNVGLMQFNAAIDIYKQALMIQPDHAGTYNNMGVAFNGRGDPEAAIHSYTQALKINPNLCEAYNNMGLALHSKGDLEPSVTSYKRALKIKPDYAEAYYNMGNVLTMKSDLEAAIDSYKKALNIKSDYPEAYANMANVLKGAVFAKPNVNMQKIIISILDLKSYVRPSEIFQASMSLLKFEPAIKNLLEQWSAGDVRQPLKSLISNLSEVPLLFRLMSLCPLADIELETALTSLRSALLLSISEISNSGEILPFQSALALQCFTNEYVYNQNDIETQALGALEASIEQVFLKGGQPSSQSILCLASYKALHEYEWSELLTMTTGIEEVFTRQVLEPKQEAQLKFDMPVLQKIANKVSAKVREQYEENPYPRWVNLRLRLDSAPIFKVIKELELRLFDNTINHCEAPNILIAGCGTGQHSIGTASRFKNSKVLAVDLSQSSLAYAKRKTEELGLQNIDYMQADILDLGKLDRKFDIIESVGVLHHMDEPMAGWRVLTDCLKLGGLMNIGLYSELARHDIVRVRKEISQSRIGSSDSAMKSFRIGVIRSKKAHHKSIVSSPDFYSLSELRDLLFHAQEHQFTIPQIQKCLDELDLNFCGFAAQGIVQDFKLTNTGANDPYDLSKWRSYEEANPSIFLGMYQFWCQKLA